MVEKSDEEVAALVQRGDAESYGILVERYEERLLRYARRFLFDRPDAKDLIQEVFLKTYMNIRGFDTGRKFSSWIYRIAHNEFINAIKRRGTEPVSFFDPDTIFPHPVARETADREANSRELKEFLDHGLEKLDPKYREPLVLYYYEEKDYSDIADILNIPVSTVGVRLNRGRAMLKAEMRMRKYHD